MGLGETSLKWRCAIFLSFIGFVMMIAAVASTYMATVEIIPNLEKHIGFWYICDDTRTYSCQDFTEYLKEISENSDWVHGCRALVVIGMIIEGLTIVVSVYMAYMAAGMNIGHMVAACSDFVSVVINLIGGLVFLANSMDILQSQLEMDSDPSWSFVVFIISQGLFLIAGGLQVFEACRADS
ncbi:hypothetical protein PoB_006387700 [Plakobranchus ocellatus]|uniref:Uncharacterized protein n=1 Tax=Plakobranchus ocellatus TaxID=259542 RepID=A0AAV4CZJ9_9GAST|nr:hypothetical protein PoB_006387700 [Plakobranchus ocellatus]